LKSLSEGSESSLLIERYKSANRPKGGKQMTKYEIMYILNSTLDEETRKATIEGLNKILTDNGATISDVNEWGNRELAYEINKQTRGYYVVLTLTANDAKAINEFDRLTKINNKVLRHMIVNLDK
jgi:small subunit ribosomal protein S6